MNTKRKKRHGYRDDKYLHFLQSLPSPSQVAGGFQHRIAHGQKQGAKAALGGRRVPGDRIRPGSFPWRAARRLGARRPLLCFHHHNHYFNF